MDNLSHFLFGYILLGNRINIILILLFSNLPDIISLPFKIYYTFIVEKKKKLTEIVKWDPSTDYLKIYRFAHSLFFCLLIGVILSLFTDQYLLLVGCMASHIFLDMFTHSGKWGTRLFYPFSDFHLNSFNWFCGRKSLIVYIFISILIFSVAALRFIL